MDIVFIHGWSIRTTDAYGELPHRLAAELRLRGLTPRVEHIYLGKYVSFNDQVTLDDLALAFDAAVRDLGFSDFSAITHSTGGPLVRNWVTRFEVPRLSAATSSSTPSERSRLRHLVMLAPANHGSALAQLGKSRLGRLKAFFDGVEPGQRLLDWLEHGSEEQWHLNREWLHFDAPALGLYPFTLTGQSIDHHLYDHLNSYTGEPGSDGVIRVAAANLNFSYVRLEQDASGLLHLAQQTTAPPTVFSILPNTSHSAGRLGIMASVPPAGPHPTLSTILDCLAINSPAAYQDFTVRHRQSLSTSPTTGTPPHCLVVFRVIDNHGQLLSDYDLLFTAGPDASPDQLPSGFFRDRQRNRHHPGKLTYYLNWERLGNLPLGFRLLPRPDAGLVHYRPAEIAPRLLGSILAPHQTTMVELVLRRHVDRACFTFTGNPQPEPISGLPSGRLCP